MAAAAFGAFDRFSRARGHPAKLNFGDCMAYAVSEVMRAPLLFKGGDFGLTDDGAPGLYPDVRKKPAGLIRPALLDANLWPARGGRSPRLRPRP